MRLVSYNILDGGTGRADALGDVLAAMRPDLVALVEAEDVAVVDHIARRLDMQFLHAMAPRAGEWALETREKSLRWAEFAYRIARGEIQGRANLFDLRRAGSLDPATASWIGDLFRAPAKKHWTVQDLFLARGDRRSAAARERPASRGAGWRHAPRRSYSAPRSRRRGPSAAGRAGRR